MEREILVNQIRTPDGTVIRSTYRHDFVTYTDKNGLVYMIDGGNDYLRRTVHKTKLKWYMKVLIFFVEWDDPIAYEEMSVYSDDPFCDIREHVERGGRGVDGDQPLEWVRLKDINDEWLNNLITYELDTRPENKYLPIYMREFMYRRDHNITVE